MTGLRLPIGLLACACALALPALTLALPRSTSTYLLGAKMIRAEIALKSADGINHDFRIDRGRLKKRYGGGSLTLVERDGTKVTLKVAATARVLLNGKPATVRALRPGMQVAVPRDGDSPAAAVYAGSGKAAPTIPYATVAYLLGDRMMRAEIGLRSSDGVVHDYLLDHGKVRQVGAYSLTLREADGTMVTIGVAATARVKLNGRIASFAQLRKGMTATTMRDGDKLADQIWATGK
jgi:hypothetical protein